MYVEDRGRLVARWQDRQVAHAAAETGTPRACALTWMERWRRRGEFPTAVAGYRRAVAWLIEHGPIRAVGVEGTSSYGVGIITELRTAGFAVVEVNRTRAAEKRRPGKTDPLDAYRAARSVLSGEATTGPKSPPIEPLRALRIARRSAIKAQQATRRQINAVLVNADPALRDLPDAELLAALRDRRPEQLHHSDTADTMFTLRCPVPSGLWIQ